MRNRSTLSKIKQGAFGASMADIAMLLLVFFMSTTTTEPPKGVEVNLPKAQTKGAEQDSIYITIGRDEKIYFDSKEVSLEQLHDELAMRQNEKDRSVSVTADKDLSYETVSKVLNALQDQDFLNVLFMSEPNSAGGGQ